MKKTSIKNRRVRALRILIKDEVEKAVRTATITSQQLLTMDEAIKCFHVSRKTIDRWRVNGLPFLQTSPKAKILFKKEDILNFLNQEQW